MSNKEVHRSIQSLWEELEYFLEDDKDLKIIEKKNHILIIKALRKRAYNNSIIIGKLFGRILPHICNFSVSINENRTGHFKEDFLHYDFEIQAKKAIYKGNIIVKRV